MAMTNELETLLESRRVDDGVFAWDVPDGWQQGRGAFGGLVVAVAIRAMEKTVDDPELELRAINATLCGPVMVGEATLRVRELRRGSNTLAVTCDIEQGDEIRTHLSAFFGKRRVEDGEWSTSEPPELPDWREVDVIPIEPPMGPEFARHMEFRPVDIFPFSGADVRQARGYIRPRMAIERRSDAYLALLMDAFYPAFFSALDAPRPAATVTFMMEFFGDAQDDAPLYFRSESPEARGGYSYEHRELWSAEGELLAMNQQSFCIIK